MFIRMFLLTAVLLVATMSKVGAGETASRSTSQVPTRIGTLEFTHGFAEGYPSKTSVQKLYDEMDFQRATQAYLWALPLVSLAESQRALREVFGAADGEFVLLTSYQDRLGIITPNAITPYLWSFVDLEKSGPVVWEFGGGAHGGAIVDFWQKSLTDVGALGPDKNKAARYLVLPPGSTEPDVPGYFTVRANTRNVWLVTRAFSFDPSQVEAFYRGMRVYRYADRDLPIASQPVRVIKAGERKWSHMQPRGMAYWTSLADILQREVVLERDRQIMAMLQPLGIEKDKPFAPDARQKKLLEQAAVVGEAMAKAMAFQKREPGIRYRPETRWETVMNWHPSHETAHYHQLDELSTYSYEAVGTTPAMVTRIAGVGQAYLSAYRDGQGEWLDGGKAYRLRVPPNVPAKQFWSLTAYDVATRSLIINPQQVSERSSRQNLASNADGSVDLYLAPDKSAVPAGMESNWIPTIKGRAWFAYFRFYAPLAGYLDASWQLPDFEILPPSKGTKQ
jgi:hypothetical protein